MKNQFPKTKTASQKRFLGDFILQGRSGKSIDFTAFFEVPLTSNQFPKNTDLKKYYVTGQTPFTHSRHFPLEFLAAENNKKILVLLSFCPCLQGFQRKKDLADFTLQGLILYLVLPLV